MSKKCMLPLPNEFQYKYGADWNNEFKLGTLALAADDFGKFCNCECNSWYWCYRSGLVNSPYYSKVTAGGKEEE